MKVFISWSGHKSRYIAETLSNWIEQVLQSVEPWISSDIEKGSRWSREIAAKLEESKIGIICLTSDNLNSNWIHFEAGAISKTIDAQVCTFLYDITPTNVQQPLSEFQNTRYNKQDVLKLLKTINSRIGKEGGKMLKEQSLESIFETFWPRLEDELKNVPVSDQVQASGRTDRELLEEALEIIRTLKPLANSEQNIKPSYGGRPLDWWIEDFAREKGLKPISYSMMPYANEIGHYILRAMGSKMNIVPIRMQKQIEEEIDNLLPF